MLSVSRFAWLHRWNDAPVLPAAPLGAIPTSVDASPPQLQSRVSAQEYLRTGGIALAVLFAAASSLVMLSWPLAFDHGIFAVNGAAVLRGGVPYRDAWETRGPLAFYLFAGIEALFGRTAFAIRFFDVLMLGAANAMLWVSVRHLTSKTAATLLAAFWSLTVVSCAYDATAQPDLWVGYAVLGAILLCVRREGYRSRDLLCAGLLVGLCTLLKPFYAGFLAAPIAAVAAQGRARGRLWPVLLRDVPVLAIAWAVPIGVTLAIIWMSGGFREFIDVHFWYNIRIYSGMDRVGMSERVRYVLEFLVRAKVIVIALPALLAGMWELWRRDRPFAAATAVALMVGTLSVVLQGKFFYYHWAPVLVLGAPPVAISLYMVCRGEMPRSSRLLGWAIVTVLALHVSLRPAKYLASWLAYAAGRQTKAEYYTGFAAGERVDPAAQMAVAAYLKQHTEAGTPIGNWGVDAAVPYLADRPSASRFPVTQLLTAAPTNPVTQQYRREFLTDMLVKRPPYVVMGHPGPRVGLPVTDIAEEIPDFGRFLGAHYMLDRRFGDLELYRRLDYAPTEHRF